MAQFKMLFKLKKETPGTFVYAEQAATDPPRVKTLYLQKWAARLLKEDGTHPDAINVTIEEA